ncbi:retrovirus-related Pol polyprotein from transposon TNT 1-94 [Trichonephila clavipes]|nr:retrovirus-related Pol polyprotein from transposon TNT 1-94 [Trichonephila clavipes]
MKKTIPYNSESNGKAERANRVLLERARSLLYESKLPLKFWAEAINCITQVSNVTPRKGKEKFPLEIWTGRRGIMLGYARERRGYRIYDIKNQKTTSSPRTGRIQIPVLELNDVQNQIPVRRSERLKSKLMSVHLVNNVPNSYFEAENSANWKNWKLAMENELDSLDKHKDLIYHPKGRVGSRVVKGSKRGWLVTSSSSVKLKARHEGVRCTLHLSRAQTSSHWCGVVVRRGGASSGVVHVT